MEREKEAAAFADALAKELTEARRRGLADIDLVTSQQRRVEALLLEDLARRYTGDHHRGRIELIKLLVRDALPGYGTAHNEGDAQLVRRLFFDEKTGEAPGPKRPIGLRAAAIQAGGFTEDSFNKRRHAVFRDFAGFLLDFVDASQSPAPEVTSEPHHRRRLILLSAIVVALAVVATFLSLTRPVAGEQPAGNNAGGSTVAGIPTAARPPPSSPVGAVQTATLTFDDLGGWSTIIAVYAGVQDLPQDKQQTGTFHSGETVRTVCQTTGRTITSDTQGGERPQQSNVWVRIDGSPGVQQYASLTYGDISSDALAMLPTCADAP